MSVMREIPPLPVADDEQVIVLRQARRLATEAVTAAEAAEADARRLRKHAKNRIRQYEKLVAEFNGQLRIPDTD